MWFTYGTDDNLGDGGCVTIPCYGIAFPAHPNCCYNHTIILNRKNDRATCVARILVQCLDVLCETVTRKKKSQNKLRGLDDNANLQQKILRSLFWPQKHSWKYRIISPCCTIQTGRSDLFIRGALNVVAVVLSRSYIFVMAYCFFCFLLFFFALGCISKHAVAGWTCSLFGRITRCSSSSVFVRIFADGKNRRQRQGRWWPTR